MAALRQGKTGTTNRKTGAASVSSLSMSYFAQNVAALAPHFPDLAKALEAAAIPQGFLPTRGTDGTPTFSRTIPPPPPAPPAPAADGRRRREWLGQTSAPAASAPHILHSLDAAAQGQNGLGLSIGTGFEWAAFLGRLSRHQALFVYEPDAGFVRLALEICDLSAPLAARRLVLLVGTPDEAGAVLANFLSANPGFNPPGVLHPLASIPAERRHELVAAGEAIVRHAVGHHQRLLGALQSRLEQAPITQGQVAGGALVFLLAARYAAERPLHEHARVLKATPVYVDHHAAAGIALRLQLLGDHLQRGPVRVLSDLFRTQLAVIPPEIPVETWVPPLAGAAYWDLIPGPSGLAEGDRIVVHFACHQDALRGRGIPDKQICLRPLTPGVGHSVAALQESPRSKTENRRRLALVADFPPSSAEALEITLPTHQAVYNAARDLVLADYLTIHPAMAPDLLRRALVRAGIDPRHDDPALQDPMLRIIREVMIPALPPLALAAALVSEGFPLALIGNWPGLQTALADVKMIRFEACGPEAWDDVGLVVHFSPQGTFSPILWEAVAAGVAIVAPQHPTDGHFGSLPQILAAEKQFANPLPRNLFATVKSILRDLPRREKLASAALACLAPGAVRA
jgi:hypothetical protein